jgi:type IV pilus assembly protein PilQ
MAMLATVSCATLGEQQMGETQDLRRIENVQVSELGDRVRVEIVGDGALAYDLSTSVAPASVTVDLPGFKGVDLQRIDVNKPPLLHIIPNDVVHPKPGIQLVMMLSADVEPEVKAEGTHLFVDFPVQKGSQVASDVRSRGGTAEVLEAGPAAAPDAPTMHVQDRSDDAPVAKVMTKVEVQRGERDATVIIHGDGMFQYDVKPLHHDRLVVDLAHVTSPIKLQVLPVDHQLLKQIRIGRHSGKVRLVLDLPRRSTYSVQPGAMTLSIKLDPMDSSDGATPGKKPIDREASPDRSIQSEPVRVAKAGAVPFPERLARLESGPRMAQMAPADSKTAGESEESNQPRYTGQRISLDFQGADITNVLRLIADVSGFNIVVGEAVKAKVTLKLVGVPWDQALDMLLKMNNLGMIKEGNIVWIDTLANIAKQQDEEAKTKEAKIKAEDLVTRIIYVQNVAAKELQGTLAKYVSPRGNINVNEGTNSIIIQDTESKVEAFTQLVRELDLEVPQIQIEARIVQADTTYARGLGVQWGFQNVRNLSANRTASFRGGSTGTFGAQASDFLVNLPGSVGGLPIVPAAGFTFGKTSGDGALLDMRLSAGEALGLTKVIAAPKITTLDNREAKIEQGEAIPFQTTSLQGTQTTFVDALLSIQVTPKITSRDPKEVGKQVLLKIKATRNAQGAASFSAGPSIAKREAITQVLVRDGETMVIGGIIEDVQTNQVQGLPWLSRIPVIGWLFKSKAESVNKRELLIFLTPIILKS